MRNKRTRKKKKDFPHTKGKTRNRRLKHLFPSFSRGKNYFSENNGKASVGEEKRKIHVVGNRCEEGNFLTGSDQKISSGGKKGRSENSKRSVLARTGFLQQQDYYLPTGGGEGRGEGRSLLTQRGKRERERTDRNFNSSNCANFLFPLHKQSLP